MAVEITLALPESLLQKVEKFGAATHQDLGTVLADALELMLPMIEDSPDAILYQPVTTLSDEEVLQLAESKMDAVQNRRLGALQARGKAAGLSLDERYELLALLRIYQTGQLRKAEALAEAVRRGLREPLTA